METFGLLWLFRQIFSFHLSIANAILGYIFRAFIRFQWPPPFFIPLIDSLLFIHFRSCNLFPCTLDLDDQTTIHFWAPIHRKFNKPNLVLIHGYGGNSKWQFLFQSRSLAQSFNLYVPDLLFFGKSYTRRPDRTDVFQAKCLTEGLKRLGVDRYSVYAVSYGGFVGYRMAEMCGEGVDKVVIVSSGIGCTEEQKKKQLGKIGRNAQDLLLPENPEDLRLLVSLSFWKCNPVRWVPDFFLHEYIHVMCNTHRKEKAELARHLLENNPESELPVLNQETLLIWGDKDMVFPLAFGRQLQRHLGSKTKMEIIQNTGHAANLESASLVANSIKAFLLASS